MKHGIYSTFFFLQNVACFIILTYLVPVLFTFYIQVVLKLKKKIIPVPKSLFHNSETFGSCIIQILYTGCAKIQINNSGAKRLTGLI